MFLVRMFFGSAKSATVKVTIGFGVPGFGYLKDLISGYRYASSPPPYHGNFCSSTSESLKVAYSIMWPSFDIHNAMLDDITSSVMGMIKIFLETTIDVLI